MAGEKRQPSSSLRSEEVSVALTTTLHAHQARCNPPPPSLPTQHTQPPLMPPPSTPNKHRTYPTMHWIIVTSVIFAEALRESNHESSAWNAEWSLFCWAVPLDSTPPHCYTRRPHMPTLSPHFTQVTHVEWRNTAFCCGNAQIASLCLTFFFVKESLLWL